MRQGNWQKRASLSILNVLDTKRIHLTNDYLSPMEKEIAY